MSTCNKHVYNAQYGLSAPAKVMLYTTYHKKAKVRGMQCATSYTGVSGTGSSILYTGITVNDSNMAPSLVSVGVVHAPLKTVLL